MFKALPAYVVDNITSLMWPGQLCGAESSHPANRFFLQFVRHINFRLDSRIVLRFHLEVPTMFDQLFKAQRARERHFNAPLLDERICYLTHWAAQGSIRSSLRVRAQDLLTIIDCLQLETPGEIDEKQIYKAADRWATRQPQPPNVIDFRYGKLRFISHARQWIAFLGRLHQSEVPRQPFAHLIEQFAGYMKEERGLSPVTVHKRCQHVTQFLSRFDEQHRPFKEISILDIDAAVARKGEQDAYTRSSMRTYANALRAFFHYAEQRGWCASGPPTELRKRFEMNECY